MINALKCAHHSRHRLPCMMICSSLHTLFHSRTHILACLTFVKSAYQQSNSHASCHSMRERHLHFSLAHFFGTYCSDVVVCRRHCAHAASIKCAIIMPNKIIIITIIYKKIKTRYWIHGWRGETAYGIKIEHTRRRTDRNLFDKFRIAVFIRLGVISWSRSTRIRYIQANECV